jgi:uncharacterized protein YndB with AHSA1/START domain
MARTDTATRFIHAAPAAVYRAWLDPQALISWLPPTGMTGRIDRFEPHPGGAYTMTLTYDDPSIAGKTGANTDIAHGRFTRLEPDRLIEQQVVFDSPDPTFAGTMTMTWTLTPTGDGTEVTVACTDVPSGISQADHIDGISSTLQNLAEYLETVRG